MDQAEHLSHHLLALLSKKPSFQLSPQLCVSWVPSQSSQCPLGTGIHLAHFTDEEAKAQRGSHLPEVTQLSTQWSQESQTVLPGCKVHTLSCLANPLLHEMGRVIPILQRKMLKRVKAVVQEAPKKT